MSGERWGSAVRTMALVLLCSSAFISAVRGEWGRAFDAVIIVGCIACWMSEAVQRRKAEEVVRLLRDALGLQAGGHYEIVRKDDDA